MCARTCTHVCFWLNQKMVWYFTWYTAISFFSFSNQFSQLIEIINIFKKLYNIPKYKCTKIYPTIPPLTSIQVILVVLDLGHFKKILRHINTRTHTPLSSILALSLLWDSLTKRTFKRAATTFTLTSTFTPTTITLLQAIY